MIPKPLLHNHHLYVQLRKRCQENNKRIRKEYLEVYTQEDNENHVNSTWCILIFFPIRMITQLLYYYVRFFYTILRVWFFYIIFILQLLASELWKMLSAADHYEDTQTFFLTPNTYKSFWNVVLEENQNHACAWL